METVRIRDPGWEKVGSGINIPDPQHCKNLSLNSQKYVSWIRDQDCFIYMSILICLNAMFVYKYDILLLIYDMF